MLHRLDIRDYLLIRELELEFPRGFIVLTGETGAGKSMIFGAIDVLLGNSFPKGAVRSGADRAVIEGIFSSPDPDAIRSIIGEDYLEDEHDDLLIRREIPKEGRSRSFLNDHPIPREQLTKLRELLVDFHGQREHQRLFRPARQLDFLDCFAGSQTLLREFAVLRKTRHALAREFRELSEQLSAHAKDQALLSYQLEEIERLGLQAGEEQEVEQRLRKLENAEKLTLQAGELQELLTDGEQSLSVLAGRARTIASEIADTDRDLMSLASELREIESRLKDIGGQIRDYASGVVMDEQELNVLRERRGVLWELKRKHGMTVDEIIARAGELKQLLETGEELKTCVEKLQEQLAEADHRLRECGLRLSKRRQKHVAGFTKRIEIKLRPLGFEKARFEIELRSPEELDPETVGRSGGDEIEFRFAANPGSSIRSLTEAASGGESSRITLAVKSVIAEKVQFPLMIYDEMDLGISGGTAERVGKELSTLGRRHQLIVITHLPQIASQADHHLLVEKTIRGRTTTTTARFIEKEERIAAIATLLSGAKISGHAMQSAGELLKQNRANQERAKTVG